MPRFEGTAREREIAVRTGLICLSGWIGGIFGIAYTNDWHMEWGMFIPPFGLLIGSIITPVANVVMAVTGLASGVYIFTQVPRWSCIVCGSLVGVVVAMVRLMWRSG